MSEIVDYQTGEVITLDAEGLGRIRESKLCLHLPNDLTFDNWRAYGIELSKMERGVQWWIGDWWAFGGQQYGERARAAAEGIFGRAFQTLANAASVSRKFETSRRREVLPWSYHAEVCGLDDDLAERFLNEAEENNWKRRELRAAVSRHKTHDKIIEHDEVQTCKVSNLLSLVAAGKRFGTIYADPPWRYDNQGTRAATGGHYKGVEEDGVEVQSAAGMTIEEICALPIGDLAAPDAHLHLWTTNGFLFECPKIFEAWGFEFRSSFIWVKPQIGIGNYWRNSHEFMLTAIRGNAKRFNDHSLKSWLECERGAHSAKPEQVRHFIERSSPGPYLELFGRHSAPGWAVWGNQISETLFNHAVEEFA